MKYYLGIIKHRPNVKWIEIHKLIQAETREEAERKLRKWADKNVSDQNILTNTRKAFKPFISRGYKKRYEDGCIKNLGLLQTHQN